MSRLKEMYDSEIKAAMMKKFGYKNEMQIPKLVKIVVNMGVGDAKDNHKLLDAAVNDMQIITGQKAVICKAKKSVANFKLREGMPIGCKVTLRGDRMYEFADRLIILLYHEYVTSEVLILTLSTEEVITHWELRNSLSSLKSSTIRLRR